MKFELEITEEEIKALIVVGLKATFGIDALSVDQIRLLAHPYEPSEGPPEGVDYFECPIKATAWYELKRKSDETI